MRSKVLVSITLVLLLTACNEESISTNAVKSEGFECPSTHPIKGNRNDKGEWIYHKPGQQYYKKTDAEECFATDEDAVAAGYRKSKR